jgi:neutral ceramidase
MNRTMARIALATSVLALPAIAAVAPVVAQIPGAAAASDTRTAGSLRAGSARVEITPAVADLPKPFTGIESRLYVRTTVLDAGGQRVVLVVADLPMIAPDVFDNLVSRISAESGAPAANILLAVTHTHDTVRLDNNPVGIILPGSAKITRITSDQILSSVRQAVAGLQPARAGYANGTFKLAGNNNDAVGAENAAISGRTQSADASIGVFKVESLKGETIALMVSNGPGPGLPGVGGGERSLVSADMAGMIERYVEQRYGDKAVAMYTVGAPMGVAINARQRAPGLVPPNAATLKGAVAAVLGEEVVATATRMKTFDYLPMAASLEILRCPGKSTYPLNNPGSCSDAPGAKLPACVFTDKDIPPVPLRFGAIRLGDFTIVHSDANVMPGLWNRVKRGAPIPGNTMLVSLGYGPVHYVVPDDDYPSNSYPVTASMVKRGCAAEGFVNGALKMLGTTRPAPAG